MVLVALTCREMNYYHLLCNIVYLYILTHRYKDNSLRNISFDWFTAMRLRKDFTILTMKISFQVVKYTVITRHTYLGQTVPSV